MVISVCQELLSKDCHSCCNWGYVIMFVRGLLLILSQGIVANFEFMSGWLLTFPEGFFQ